MPALYELVAKKEIAEYEAERRSVPAPMPPAPQGGRRDALLAQASLLLLLFWHFAGDGMAKSFLGLSASLLDLGAYDFFKIRFHGEWSRVFTSLTLHLDPAHLFGNLLFGAIFIGMLAKTAGWGASLLYAVAGGALANAIKALLDLGGTRCAGFSTSVFVAIGAVCGEMIRSEANKRQLFLPLGAAGGLLALLGMGGEQTDIASHILGLACGCALGYLGLPQRTRLARIRHIQAACALAALLLLLVPWALALGGA